MSTILAIVLFLGALLVYICILGLVQYLLCRLTPPWPGLIIPVLSGIGSVTLSLLFLFNLAAFSLPAVLMSLLLLVLLNLPTAVYIVIYHITRRRLQERDEVERMNLQDL
ncbi:hypothetical protein WMO64_10855 [Pseudoflavonifractor sp. CLA-AP-H29]|uniref:Uncharacterized protein n=1 Tax=Pseudoflavonifractor intestinihominis TaxID=3133171 RepID=A0ABV1E9H1_9FIRM